MGKHRRWQAVLTVSASGPEHSSIFEESGRYLRPRMAADLRYTTADADFLYNWARKPGYDSSEFELHRRLVNPTLAELLKALQECGAWLRSHSTHNGWDGGGILLCFAGHGREGDGALVLQDGDFSPARFCDVLVGIADAASGSGRLRVSAVLDSCYSGAFATALLHACLDEHSEKLIPLNVFASCMHDEGAWEESSLGHGVFTYAFSIRETTLGGLGAEAVQPDNTFGPSLSMAGGNLGCSLLTAGAQNPVVYWNGTGYAEVGEDDLNLIREDGTCMGLPEMRSSLRELRDRYAAQVRMMRPTFHVGRTSQDEMRGHVAQLRSDLEKQRAAGG